MRPRTRAQALAVAGAAAVFLVLLLALRLRNWLPFLGALLTYLGLFYAWRPASHPPRPSQVALPEGVTPDDHRVALDTLARARAELDALAAGAPAAEVPLVRRMAALVGAIRRHHEANPAHVPRTRTFVRHALPRMVAAVAGYVDLARRAGPARDQAGRDERLAEVARRLEGFVPALEKIDRACLEDDLLALEITVEVLNEQLGRDRDA